MEIWLSRFLALNVGSSSSAILCMCWFRLKRDEDTVLKGVFENVCDKECVTYSPVHDGLARWLSIV